MRACHEGVAYILVKNFNSNSKELLAALKLFYTVEGVVRTKGVKSQRYTHEDFLVNNSLCDSRAVPRQYPNPSCQKCCG